MGFVLIIMGVSGCGKTTTGKELAKKLSCDFIDADDYHSIRSVEKMNNGFPLTDQDRKDWLEKLSGLIKSYTTTTQHIKRKVSAILACSALKKSYRDLFRSSAPSPTVFFIYLKGEQSTISKRLLERNDHYMPESLLQSQFDALEEPTTTEECFIADGESSVQTIVNEIVEELVKQDMT